MGHLVKLVAGILRRFAIGVGAVGLTLVFFFVLPLIQAIGQQDDSDVVLTTVDAAELPPPPPPIEEQPPPEEQPEEAPPELAEETQPLDLSQLELALDPGGFSDSWLGGDFAVQLNTVTSGAAVESLFSMADLDQKPRVIHQPSPQLSAKLRRQTPATVHVLFLVDPSGRVTKPKVQKSTNPAFERAALDAVKQWRFEPGKRKGEAVSFRMRVPITFPQS
ncbi:MAG: energy transducer TonB [Planctomycetota bacterium]|nr:energy transducer TonB [Planctomycetota bacterium]